MRLSTYTKPSKFSSNFSKTRAAEKYTTVRGAFGAYSLLAALATKGLVYPQNVHLSFGGRKVSHVPAMPTRALIGLRAITNNQPLTLTTQMAVRRALFNSAPVLGKLKYNAIGISYRLVFGVTRRLFTLTLRALQSPRRAYPCGRSYHQRHHQMDISARWRRFSKGRYLERRLTRYTKYRWRGRVRFFKGVARALFARTWTHKAANLGRKRRYFQYLVPKKFPRLFRVFFRNYGFKRRLRGLHYYVQHYLSVRGTVRRFKRTWYKTSRYKRLKSQRNNWIYRVSGYRKIPRGYLAFYAGTCFDGSMAYTTGMGGNVHRPVFPFHRRGVPYFGRKRSTRRILRATNRTARRVLRFIARINRHMARVVRSSVLKDRIVRAWGLDTYSWDLFNFRYFRWNKHYTWFKRLATRNAGLSRKLFSAWSIRLTDGLGRGMVQSLWEPKSYELDLFNTYRSAGERGLRALRSGEIAKVIKTLRRAKWRVGPITAGKFTTGAVDRFLARACLRTRRLYNKARLFEQTIRHNRARSGAWVSQLWYLSCKLRSRFNRQRSRALRAGGLNTRVQTVTLEHRLMPDQLKSLRYLRSRYRSKRRTGRTFVPLRLQWATKPTHAFDSKFVYYNNKPRNRSAGVFRRLIVHKAVQTFNTKSVASLVAMAAGSTIHRKAYTPSVGSALLQLFQTKPVAFRGVNLSVLPKAEVFAGFAKKRKVKPMTKAQLLKSLNKVVVNANRGFNPFVPHNQQRPARTDSYRQGSGSEVKTHRGNTSQKYTQTGGKPARTDSYRQGSGSEVKTHRGNTSQKYTQTGGKPTRSESYKQESGTQKPHNQKKPTHPDTYKKGLSAEPKTPRDNTSPKRHQTSNKPVPSGN